MASGKSQLREAGVLLRGTKQPHRNATSALGLPVTKTQSTYEKMLRVPVNNQENGDVWGTQWTKI